MGSWRWCWPTFPRGLQSVAPEPLIRQRRRKPVSALSRPWAPPRVKELSSHGLDVGLAGSPPAGPAQPRATGKAVTLRPTRFAALAGKKQLEKARLGLQCLGAGPKPNLGCRPVAALLPPWAGRAALSGMGQAAPLPPPRDLSDSSTSPSQWVVSAKC